MRYDKEKRIAYRNYLFKVLTMIFLLVSVTFCWFVLTKESSLDSINVEVTGVLSVTISDSKKEEWDSKLEIESEIRNNTITEFSGNGEKLYMPIIARNQVTGYYINEDSLNTDELEKDYIEVITYVKTDGPICLYLGEDSSITPYKDNNLEDCIAGAIRVAVLIENYEPFIWAPNSTYEYNEQEGTVNKNGIPESQYTYVYKDSEEEFLSTSDIVVVDNSELKPAGVSNNKRFVWGNLMDIENYTDVVDPIFKTSKDLTEEIEIKMVIRIWVEGTDREAVKQLIGGKFVINLSFLATDNK